MKTPENYIILSDMDTIKKKYKSWGFPAGKKNSLPPDLLYKGIYTEAHEPCEIVGYSSEAPKDTVVIIKLKSSGALIPIDRNYLKQMQKKDFSLDQTDSEECDDSDNSAESVSFKELDELVDDYVVYDIETTGFSPSSDEIIEIAAIKISHNTIVEQFESLVRPSCEISQKTTKLTGIDNLMVVNAPDLADVFNKFIDFVGTNVLIGHNIKGFDNIFIANTSKKFKKYLFTTKFLDTLSISRILLPDLKSHTLDDLIDYYQIERTKRQHRALNDCEYTYKVYEKMKVQVVNNYGSLSAITSSHKATVKSGSDKAHNKYPKYDDLRSITTSITIFDESHPLFGKSCVFTGELQKYSREEAAQLIVDLGGKCENNVTKKTNFLIVSDDSNPNKKSSKQQKAEEYKLKGQDIEIISETEFYDMLEQ